MTIGPAIEMAIINLTTITLPLVLIIMRMERRLTRLETEHTIFHQNHK